MQYPERESKQLEFKSTLPNFQILIKTCVAFSNGIGGRLMIGIEDRTREIIGVDNSTRDRVYDEFTNGLYDSTTPSLIPEIYEKNLCGKNVIVIEIASSNNKPVFVTKEGVEKGVYLRAGSSTRRVSENQINELKKDNQRIPFDEEPIRHKDILEKSMLNRLYKQVTNQKLVSEKVITSSPRNSSRYYPTITGILWFCPDPENYIPESLVRCTRFQGISGRQIIQNEEITGSLSEQIEKSYNLVISWLHRDFKLSGTKLESSIILPKEALREAIINALVHRKYSIPGAVKIAIYDDRLEIFSPGNFPGLIDINNLGDGTTYLRNPNIAKIARRHGYMEKLGTGISLMLSSCKDAGLKQPEFIENADSVKIIFYFVPELSISDSDEEKLIKYFEFYNQATIADILEILKVSRNTATRKLNKLVKQGILTRTGKGPAVRYIKS